MALRRQCFRASILMTALTAALDTYLAGFERERTESRGSAFTFTSKVTALQASELKVVAFVQDENTKGILQAMVINPS